MKKEVIIIEADVKKANEGVKEINKSLKETKDNTIFWMLVFWGIVNICFLIVIFILIKYIIKMRKQIVGLENMIQKLQQYIARTSGYGA